MDKAVSAADANRNFSKILQGVRPGRSYFATSHGKPVAKIVPVSESDAMASSAWAHLANEVPFSAGRGRWPLDPRGTI